MSKLLQSPVISNIEVAPGIFNLVMASPELALLAKPGQFLNIRVGGATAPLLRRPISIHWVEADRVEVLYQVVGMGTEILARVRTGDKLDVQGPLGHGFEPQGQGQAILVGGGMGIAPLGYLAQALKGREMICLLGARNAELLQAAGGRRLAELGVPVHYATDDGSLGSKGLVTELLAQQLPKQATIYACGPKPMLRLVAKLALERHIPCQVSLEEHMGCGVGACLGCVCKGTTPTGSETLRRVCTDGPVFAAEEVVWE